MGRIVSTSPTQLISMLKSYPASQNIILFGNRGITDRIS